MSAPTFPFIYETKFAPSDKTDAVLVVEGKKLHVNKAFLSIHSDFFNTLFNSDFKEKSQDEIEIKDVNFYGFATVLSLLYPNPINPTAKNAEKLLKLADRFLLPAAKRHLELFIISTDIPFLKKMELADKYGLDTLLDHTLRKITKKENLAPSRNFSKFSDKTKARILDCQIEMSNVDDGSTATNFPGSGQYQYSLENGPLQDRFRRAIEERLRHAL